ncbi:aryl-sulfate sulfotransferase [Halostella pelagica]|uniref:aryl-sulfate sulfotransferase n=1 Tax=Halostella pelagica TaxID=2583824 RepID=UPI001081CB9F|nr:aryl-sulfate sulfotransferase [Halostella pelagica]
MDRRTRVVALSAVVLVLTAVFGLQVVLTDTTQQGTAVASGAGEPYPGNTLISVQSYGDDFDGKAMEVTPDGDRVWVYDPPNSRVFDSEMLDNGNLLVAVATKVKRDNCPTAQILYHSQECVHNRILEIDGDTLAGDDEEIVWRYTWYDEYVLNHEVHDVDRLDSGETAIADMGNDRAFTVARNGTVTWQWNATDHLGDGTEFHEEYGGPEGEGSERDWTHMNDIDHLDNGNFQLSVRNFDTVIEVDPETNEIVGMVGEPGDHETMYEQHNPQRLDEWGTLLVSDSENNRVIEYSVDNGTSVWAYGGSDLLFWPRDADRLPNGNTLIVDTYNDRVVEVDSNGAVVWEYRGVAMPYSADRLSVPEEGGETVPGWRLGSRTAEQSMVAETAAKAEAWARFVFPNWIRLSHLLTISAGALASLLIVLDFAVLGTRRLWTVLRNDRSR